jgi:protein TonB
MLSTSDAILSAARSDWSEPACARQAEPEITAPALPVRRQLRPSIAFALSFALHAAAAVALWQWAPVFVPDMEKPPLEVVLRAGDHDGAAMQAQATPIEPPPLPQPKPRALTPRKPAPAPIPLVAATDLPKPALEEPAPATVSAPVVIPDSPVDGADTVASTTSAAERASVRILSYLSQYRRYPASARRAKLEGTVEIVVVLLPDGRLVQQRIAQSSGHAVLDQAALELLRRASPVPAATFETGAAAELELHLPIVYRLSI